VKEKAKALEMINEIIIRNGSENGYWEINL
jgi:hypothetical protein